MKAKLVFKIVGFVANCFRNVEMNFGIRSMAFDASGTMCEMSSLANDLPNENC